MTFSPSQLALCQQGDSKSQRELYDAFKAKVMGTCARYTRNKEEAKDVFQETFIKVFQHLQQLQDFERLESWIRKITVNAAITYYHKNKKHKHIEEKNGYDYQNHDYELILAHFSDEMIVEIVNHLPDGYRMVLNLHLVEGFNHAEIAALLQISEGTSRSQLTKAKGIVRNKLRAMGILKFEKYA
jgi:RNA polymerase sigma factor (sigma-70 family)